MKLPDSCGGKENHSRIARHFSIFFRAQLDNEIPVDNKEAMMNQFVVVTNKIVKSVPAGAVDHGSKIKSQGGRLFKVYLSTSSLCRVAGIQSHV
jgi:hypothetical protein